MKASLQVTFGKAWYKVVGMSVLSGLFAAATTYLTGKMVFKDTFAQTEVVPLEEES